MPLILNGSTGISGTDGSAGTPAVQGTDTNTGMYFPAADQIAFAEGGVEAMRLDASGNVGIGVAAPARRLDIQQSGTNYQLRIGDAGGANFYDIGRDTGNGLLTFYGSQAVASGYVFSTVNGERARITPAGDFQFNSGYGSVATAFGCRAWVNFNGTGTVAIRASGNVSSITDNGTGDYRVNLTAAMPDVNYAVVTGASRTDAIGAISQALTPRSLAAGSFVVKADYDNNTYVDFANCYCAIFR